VELRISFLAALQPVRRQLPEQIAQLLSRRPLAAERLQM
jgi:hypothetical protein